MGKVTALRGPVYETLTEFLKRGSTHRDITPYHGATYLPTMSAITSMVPTDNGKYRIGILGGCNCSGCSIDILDVETDEIRLLVQ